MKSRSSSGNDLTTTMYEMRRCSILRQSMQHEIATEHLLEQCSQERSDRIDRRMEALLVGGYRCFSQAFYQAERMIDNKELLTKSELNKIRTECEEECCKPCADERHWYEAWRLKYERERLPKHDKEADMTLDAWLDNDYERPEWSSSSRNTTSSTMLASVDTAADFAWQEKKRRRK